MIVGVYGYQDSGKTAMVEKLVGELSRKGYRVASVKHSPHKKSADCAGKDTWRHWKAGADPVVFSSDNETTVFSHKGSSMDRIARLLMEDFSPEVIIIEGLKEGDFPKVSIGAIEPKEGTVLRDPSLKELVRYIESEIAVERVLSKLPGLDCGKCGLDCRRLAVAIARGKKLMKHCRELSNREVAVLVNGNRMPLGNFPSAIVDETIRGLLGSMRGYEKGAAVEIRLGAKRRVTKRDTR